MSKKKSIENVGWFSLAEMAAAFGVTTQAFGKSVRPLLSSADVRGDGKRGVQIRCRAAIDAWAGKKAEQAAAEALKKGDPLLTGANSPSLEEYRKHRAAIAKMDAEQRQGTHVALAEINDVLNRFSATLRRGGEILQRRYGSEAAKIYNDAIGEAESTLKNELDKNHAK